MTAFRPTRTMSLCMLLAPHLATFTYACPHAIVTTAVAGAAAINLRPKTVSVRKPVPPPANVDVHVEPTTVTSRPADLLVYNNDAWRSTASMTSDVRASHRH